MYYIYIKARWGNNELYDYTSYEEAKKSYDFLAKYTKQNANFGVFFIKGKCLEKSSPKTLKELLLIWIRIFTFDKCKKLIIF